MPGDSERKFQVTGYTVYLGDKLLLAAGTGSASAAGKPMAPRAFIECTGVNGGVLVFFLDKARSGPENDSDKFPNETTENDGGVRGVIYAPSNQYPWYLDLLRSDDPVYVTLDLETPLNNRMECGTTLPLVG